MNKPPLGVAPYYVVGYGRIQDLNKAIDRQMESDNPNLLCVKEWAREIVAQCDLVLKMRDE